MAFKQRVSKALRVAGAFINLWASLLALGLVPTVATVAAVVVGLVTGAYQQALVVALVIALVVDLALLFLLIRARSYANVLVADMELIGNLMRERREPAPPWLPDEDGHLPVSNADFERFFEDALTLARSVAADTALGVGWIALSQPQISFNGFTQSGRKRLRIWCDPKNGCQIVQLERSETSVYPIVEPQWRTDSSWGELVTKAIAVEAPFEGSIMLWPQASALPTRTGQWRVEFRRETEGTVDRPTSYVLLDGELQRGRG